MFFDLDNFITVILVCAKILWHIMRAVWACNHMSGQQHEFTTETEEGTEAPALSCLFSLPVCRRVSTTSKLCLRVLLRSAPESWYTRLCWIPLPLESGHQDWKIYPLPPCRVTECNSSPGAVHCDRRHQYANHSKQ